jgi:hypothetical protein
MRRDGVVAALLFATLVLLYNVNATVLRSNDTRAARYASVSLVKRGDLDLDEFARSLGIRGPGAPLPYFLSRGVDGSVVSRFGFGAPVAAAPVFAVALAAQGGGMTDRAGAYVGKLASSLYVALAAAMLFLAARRLGAGRRAAVLVALIYGVLGTAWSQVAQGLYQHGPAQACLALGMYLLVRNGPVSVPLSGLAFAGAVVCRPPDAVFAVAALAYVVVRAVRRREAGAAIGFVLAAAPLAVVQAAYNLHYFGEPFTFSQMQRVLGPDNPHASPYWSGHPLVGFFGQLLSPSRGLLVYSPVYLFLFWRVRETWASLPGAVRAQVIAAAVLLLVQSRYYGWYGGWSFGYRMLVDATPALALALLPAVQRLSSARRLIAPFALACAMSLAIHAAGAWCFTPLGWDARPDVDQHPERLWQLEDSQLTYLFTHLTPRD